MIYNQVISNLQKLKLDKMCTCLSTYLTEIDQKKISFLDALFYLTQKEIEFKEQRASEFNIRIAGFPFIRTLDEFDFNLNKMSVSGALFDMVKLLDVSKSVISRFDAEKVYNESLKWADKYDEELAEVEEKIQEGTFEKKVKMNRRETPNKTDYKYAEDLLRDKLDTKVRIRDKKIEIHFTNVADLNRILEIIQVKES